VRVEQHVRRFHVTVQNARRVHAMQHLRQLERDPERAPRRQRSGLERLGQAAVAEAPLHEHRPLAAVDHTERLDDPGSGDLVEDGPLGMQISKASFD
jgi:hypothetical protein